LIGLLKTPAACYSKEPKYRDSSLRCAALKMARRAGILPASSRASETLALHYHDMVNRGLTALLSERQCGGAQRQNERRWAQRSSWLFTSWRRRILSDEKT